MTRNDKNENNVMVLGEWEDLFGNTMKITNFNEFSCDSSNEDDVDINYNNKERRTWAKTLNAAITEFYFVGRPKHEEGKPV